MITFDAVLDILTDEVCYNPDYREKFYILKTEKHARGVLLTMVSS